MDEAAVWRTDSRNLPSTCEILEGRIRGCPVTLTGPYPPTYGGVSVHIRRLHGRLLHAGIESRVYCHSSWQRETEHDREVIPRPYLGWPLDYLWFVLYPGIPVRRGIVHFHDSWMYFSPSLLRLHAMGRQVVITVHDQRDADRWAETSLPLRFACRLLARQQKVQWIAVSGRIKEQLTAHGVSRHAVTVIPAFIPLDEERRSSCGLPQEIETFCCAHRPVMSIYGFRYRMDNGLDMYGFDMAIEALHTLRSTFPSMGLVICVPEPHLWEYHRMLERRVSDLGLKDSVLFITRPLPEALPLWAASTVYLRPTSTDGDAVAVRESLSVGTPVVASDAAPRPAGTIVFPSRNREKFLEGICRALKGGSRTVRGPIGFDRDQGYREILQVYVRAIDGAP